MYSFTTEQTNRKSNVCDLLDKYVHLAEAVEYKDIQLSKYRTLVMSRLLATMSGSTVVDVDKGSHNDNTSS